MDGVETAVRFACTAATTVSIRFLGRVSVPSNCQPSDFTAFSTIFDNSSPVSSRSRNLLSRGNDENDRRIDPRGESTSERTNNYNYVNYVTFLFFPLETNKYTRSSISIHLFPFSLEKLLLSKKFLFSFIRISIISSNRIVLDPSFPPPFPLEDFYLTKTKHRRGIRSCH